MFIYGNITGCHVYFLTWLFFFYEWTFKMNIVLAIVIFSFCLLKRKESILLLPVVPLFFSKGLLFVDHFAIPVISFYRLYVFCLILSYLIHFIVNRKITISYSQLYKPLFILTGSYCLILFANLNDSTSGTVVLMSFLIDVLFPSLLLINIVTNLNKLSLTRWLKFYMYTYVCVAIYGIISYLIEFNPFVILMESTIYTDRVKVHTYSDTIRGLRAQGTVYHPMNFGALMVFGILMSIVMRKFKIINPFCYVFILVSFLTAIYVTNSRSPIIFLFFFLLFSSLSLSLIKKIKY